MSEIDIQFNDEGLIPEKISSEDLLRYRSDEDFTYAQTQLNESFWNDVKAWFQEYFSDLFKSIFGEVRGGEFLEAIFTILPYLLYLLFAYLVFWFFYKIRPMGFLSSKGNPNRVFVSEEERILKTENIQDLVNKAIEEKQYRLAIRYEYLYVLKQLMAKELIDWQQFKTNEDYQNDLKSTHVHPLFCEITRIYDFTWYGVFPIDSVRFAVLQTPFKNINLALSKNND